MLQRGSYVSKLPQSQRPVPPPLLATQADPTGASSDTCHAEWHHFLSSREDISEERPAYSLLYEQSEGHSTEDSQEKQNREINN